MDNIADESEMAPFLKSYGGKNNIIDTKEEIAHAIKAVDNWNREKGYYTVVFNQDVPRFYELQPKGFIGEQNLELVQNAIKNFKDVFGDVYAKLTEKLRTKKEIENFNEVQKEFEKWYCWKVGRTLHSKL